MKYIEEIENGDCFEYKGSKFLLTSDFRKNGNRLGYNLTNGLPKWFDAQDIINVCQIYTLDCNNNLEPVKETKKSDVTI
jgi:hypothetical protein